MECDKCKEQIKILRIMHLTICGCGIKVLPKDKGGQQK
jgi:hypothetical protein